MKIILIALFHLCLSAVFVAPSGTAQSEPETKPVPLREVQDQTIFSKTCRAKLTFGKDFRYVGGQKRNLYGNAEAEQHVFAKTKPQGEVERFYWVQFEHFSRQTITPTYYPAERSTSAACSSSTTQRVGRTMRPCRSRTRRLTERPLPACYRSTVSSFRRRRCAFACFICPPPIGELSS